VTEEVGEHYNMDLSNLYTSPNCQDDHIKDDEIGGAHSIHEKLRSMYKTLFENPEEKRPEGRIILRWILGT
jgi:hypothetical protein